MKKDEVDKIKIQNQETIETLDKEHRDWRGLCAKLVKCKAKAQHGEGPSTIHLGGRRKK